MILESASLGNEIEISSCKGGKNIAALVAGDGVVESPPVVRQFTLESQKEVTIRQVVPLVLVLTGATFLNASSLTCTYRGFTDNYDRPSRRKRLSSSYRQSVRTSISQRLVSNGSSRRTHLPLGLSCCYGVNLEMCTVSDCCSS